MNINNINNISNLDELLTVIVSNKNDKDERDKKKSDIGKLISSMMHNNTPKHVFEKLLEKYEKIDKTDPLYLHLKNYKRPIIMILSDKEYNNYKTYDNTEFAYNVIPNEYEPTEAKQIIKDLLLYIYDNCHEWHKNGNNVYEDICTNRMSVFNELVKMSKKFHLTHYKSYYDNSSYLTSYINEKYDYNSYRGGKRKNRKTKHAKRRNQKAKSKKNRK
jgi:hypothetical protein